MGGTESYLSSEKCLKIFFLKVFGILKGFFQKALKPPEARSPIQNFQV